MRFTYALAALAVLVAAVVVEALPYRYAPIVSMSAVAMNEWLRLIDLHPQEPCVKTTDSMEPQPGEGCCKKADGSIMCPNA